MTRGLHSRTRLTPTDAKVWDPWFMIRNYHKSPPLGTTIGYGITAGMLGALAVNPTELVQVRLMGDGTQGRGGQEVRYKGLCDGIKNVMACEGNLGLWRGTALSVLRSAILSTSLLYTYTKTQRMLQGEVDKKKKNKSSEKIYEFSEPKTGGIMFHLFTAMVASLFTSFLTLPVDMIKTWYQYLRLDPCCNEAAILKNVVKCRSVMFLWKGFVPYYLRMFTHTFITFLLLDRLCAHHAWDNRPRPPKKWLPWEE